MRGIVITRLMAAGIVIGSATLATVCASGSAPKAAAASERVDCMHLQIQIGAFTTVGAGVDAAVFTAMSEKAEEIFRLNNQKFCGISKNQAAESAASHVFTVRSPGGKFDMQSQQSLLELEFTLTNTHTKAVLWKGDSTLIVKYYNTDNDKLSLARRLMRKMFEPLSEAGFIALPNGRFVR